MPHGWPGNDRTLPKPSLVSVECDPPWPTEHRRRPSCDARHPRSIQVGSQQAEACGMGNRNRTTDWRRDHLYPSEWARPVAPPGLAHSDGVCHRMSFTHHLHPWDWRPAANVHAGSANASQWQGPSPRCGRRPSTSASMLLPTWCDGPSAPAAVTQPNPNGSRSFTIAICPLRA